MKKRAISPWAFLFVALAFFAGSYFGNRKAIKAIAKYDAEITLYADSLRSVVSHYQPEIDSIEKLLVLNKTQLDSMAVDATLVETKYIRVAPIPVRYPDSIVNSIINLVIENPIQ